MNKLSYKSLIFPILVTVISWFLYYLTFHVNIPLEVLLLAKVGLVIGGAGTLAIYGFIKYKEHTDAFLKNLILLATVFIILIMISEVTIRFIFRDITTTGDNSSYFARRWHKANVRRNNYGFREHEYELTSSDNINRICVIGDSFTFGQGISEKDRFSNLLEKYLNKNKKIGYEVLNFGKGGAQTVDQVAILNNHVIKTNPYFILLQWLVNDFEGQDLSGRPQLMPLLPSTRLCIKLSQISAFFYLINQQWYSLQQTLGLSGSYSEYMIKRFINPEGSASQDALQALKEFIGICKKRDIPLGIVLFPSLAPDMKKAYPYDFLHNRVIELCIQEKIAYVDLRSTFSPYAENKKLWINRFDGHPNSLANRLAAEHIMKTFGQVWLKQF